ncbi:MAG: YncE family protein [Deltaproteobacteria bacterium]|nr:YncE family protein [Deltaproteobacteria bacterium]
MRKSLEFLVLILGVLSPTIVESAPPRLVVLDRIETGSQPKGVSLSPDGSRIYVTVFGRPDHDNVWVYDAATLRRVGTVSFEGNAVESISSRDGRRLFVTNFRRNRVEVIDTRTLQVTGEIEVGKNPKTMALSADGKTLFVANWSSHTISVVDLERERVVDTLRVAQNPRGMVVTGQGRLYVASFTDDVIDVFDGPRGGLHRTDRLRVCAVPRHLVMSPDEEHLYVSCYRKSLLGTVDTDDNTVQRIPIGRSPKTIDVSADGRWVVSADYGEGTVSVVDTRAMQMRRTWIDDLTMATGLALSRSGPLRVYITSFDSNQLFVMGIRPTDEEADQASVAPSRLRREPSGAPAAPSEQAPPSQRPTGEVFARLEDE